MTCEAAVSFGCSRYNQSGTHKQSRISQDIPNPSKLGQRDGGVGTVDPHHLDGTSFHHLKHGHNVNRVGPRRNLGNIDVPVVCQFLHMGRIIVVSESGEFTVTAGLSVVLSGRLAVHLWSNVSRIPASAERYTYLVDTTAGDTNVTAAEVNALVLHS